MIPLKTVLTPLTKTDPIVEVVAVDNDNKFYIVAPVEFGSPFSLDYDQMAAAYDCKDHVISIRQPTEYESWAKLSTERYTEQGREDRKAKRKIAAEPSPEQVFAALEK